MLLLDAPLTFREFMTQEELPLATVFREVLGYLRGRSDVVLFGAQAVNAYCEPARMTQDVDLLSTRASLLADELREHLLSTFHIAVRSREVVAGFGYRLYQVRKPRNRHLVDLRQVQTLPNVEVIEGIAVVAPADLVAMKSIAIAARSSKEKGLSDQLDLARLLRTFPELRSTTSTIREKISQLGGGNEAIEAWRKLVEAELQPDDDDVQDD